MQAGGHRPKQQAAAPKVMVSLMNVPTRALTSGQRIALLHALHTRLTEISRMHAVLQILPQSEATDAPGVLKRKLSPDV